MTEEMQSGHLKPCQRFDICYGLQQLTGQNDGNLLQNHYQFVEKKSINIYYEIFEDLILIVH